MRLIIVALLSIIVLSSCKEEYKEEICDKDAISHHKLVSVEEAIEKVGDGNFRFVEVSKHEDFIKEHIPGAQNIWRPDFRNTEDYPFGGMRCSHSKLQNLLRRLAVTDATQLILYDRKGGVDAMRFAWVLDSYKFSNYVILNGGLALWKQSDQPVESGPASSIKSSKYILKEGTDKSSIADFSDIIHALSDTNTLLVDTREPYEFYGRPFVSKGKLYEYKKGSYAAGTIPTSIHLNWSELSDLSNDHRIKCVKDLKYNLAREGITPDKDIIVWCQSGSRSAHTAFVLREILGYPNVKNYDGSWIEWTYRYTQGEDIDILQQTDSLEVVSIRDSLLLKI